jgi:hypothetical protein
VDGVAGYWQRFARLTLLAAAGVVAVALLAAGGQAAPARGAANSVTFPDSTGEDLAAADIVSIAVSNDNGGNLVFRLNIPNRPALTGDMGMLIFFDTDNNAGSGDPDWDGADYVIEWDGPLTGASFNGLFRWDGSDFAGPFGVPQTSLTTAYTNGVAEIRISAADLGGTKRFKFVALTFAGVVLDANGEADFTNVKIDFAPDPGKGLYAYEVRTTTPALRVQRTSTQPARPTAGKLFTVSATVVRNDGRSVASGRTVCRATISGQALRTAAAAFRGGVARCSFRIPTTARGKTLRIAMTITSGGLRVTRTFSARIN